MFDNKSETRDGFNVIVTWREDEDGYQLCSDLGRYISANDKRFSLPAWDRATETVVRTAEDMERALETEWHNRDAFRWIADNQGDTSEDEYVRQDAERLEAYENGEWRYMSPLVRVERCRIVLAKRSGMAVESDAGEADAAESAEEAIADALAEAKAKLEELRK